MPHGRPACEGGTCAAAACVKASCIASSPTSAGSCPSPEPAGPPRPPRPGRGRLRPAPTLQLAAVVYAAACAVVDPAAHEMPVFPAVLGSGVANPAAGVGRVVNIVNGSGNTVAGNTGSWRGIPGRGSGRVVNIAGEYPASRQVLPRENGRLYRRPWPLSPALWSQAARLRPVTDTCPRARSA